MIDVPQKLSKEQESAVEQLSKTLDGDPRAGLFANNGSASRQDAADTDAAAKGAGDGS